jgi:hypothetical protein
VDVEERIYFVEPERRQYLGNPDVATSRLKQRPDMAAVGGQTSTSVLEFVETDVEVLEFGEEARVFRLEIRDAPGRDLVTVIELLSPTNKSDCHGREQYLGKRNLYFNSDINFIEIDLLRAGGPMPFHGETIGADYRVLIARSADLPRAKLREFNVRAPIPPIPIPLRPGEAEPTLDLNAVLHGVYERARYDIRIDYSVPPVPPLRADDAEWAAGIVAMQARS